MGIPAVSGLEGSFSVLSAEKFSEQESPFGESVRYAQRLV